MGYPCLRTVQLHLQIQKDPMITPDIPVWIWRALGAAFSFPSDVLCDPREVIYCLLSCCSYLKKGNNDSLLLRVSDALIKRWVTQKIHLVFFEENKPGSEECTAQYKDSTCLSAIFPSLLCHPTENCEDLILLYLHPGCSGPQLASYWYVTL